MGPEHWKWRPYKGRPLVSKSIYAKKGPPSANQGLIYRVQMWPCCLHSLGAHTHLTLSPFSAHAEPISKGHCWKWQNEAESLMTPYGVIGKERVKCYNMYVFVISLPAKSLGDWFCMSRKDRTDGDGLVHPIRWKQHGYVWTWLWKFLKSIKHISPKFKWPNVSECTWCWDDTEVLG